MRSFILITLLMLSTLVMGCHSHSATSKLDDKGTHDMMSVISRYYILKNALVATDGDKASSAAKDMLTSIDGFNKSVSADAANNAAIRPYLDTIKQGCELIASVQDKNCIQQRRAFGAVSNAMYGMLRVVGLKNAGVYHEFCPMAFHDSGGYWLSEEAEIKNPYYGKKMLECGEVKDTL